VLVGAGEPDTEADPRGTEGEAELDGVAEPKAAVQLPAEKLKAEEGELDAERDTVARAEPDREPLGVPEKLPTEYSHSQPLNTAPPAVGDTEVLADRDGEPVPPALGLGEAPTLTVPLVVLLPLAEGPALPETERNGLALAEGAAVVLPGAVGADVGRALPKALTVPLGEAAGARLGTRVPVALAVGAGRSLGAFTWLAVALPLGKRSAEGAAVPDTVPDTAAADGVATGAAEALPLAVALLDAVVLSCKRRPTSCGGRAEEQHKKVRMRASFMIANARLLPLGAVTT
jgi:hypothetical protein